MMSLILTMISIALVVILSFVALLYGGSSFLNRGEQARAAQAVSEINQIRSAVSIYRVDHLRMPETIDDFVPAYLRALPDGWVAGEDEFSGHMIFEAPYLTESMCLKVNESLGIEGIPQCTPGVAVLGCCESGED
ncbi:hypothetical protein [Thioalkalivibrio thiocyanodenitrificans]|uniref:hypothetical protein n=1 Tax=Thioalkalivibrio thiocyanodenitrificans TaxID=243063 RepID=UPI00036E0319|nr:hypothetical protein [Thioalkalivibrio thiocyanodenitrificans]